MRRDLLLLVGGLLAAVVVAAAAMVALEDEDAPKPPAKASPQPLPVEPAPIDDMVGRVPPGRRIALRSSPGGEVVRELGDTTEFGSPQTVLPTGRRRGDWITVRHTSLGNDRIAWARASALDLRQRPVALDVDLSRRELVVLGDEGVQRRISVAVGAPESPTPPGEYYVTDKLPGADYGSFYGCCILALSGRQPNLPQGWSGGDRLAIHGSPTPTSGQNVTNGCFHAREADLRWLIKKVPLGTVVTVRA